MAIIKTKEKSLKIKKRNDFVMQALTIIAGLLSIPIFMLTKNKYITIILIFICFAKALSYAKKRKIYDYGIKGEEETAKVLDKLSNEYYVYNDIIIGTKEKGAQIDHLVLSPYGIFSIETKNMRGKIIGKEEEQEWKQEKRGQGSEIYVKQFYNPCKQSIGHLHAIENMLAHAGFNDVKVYSIVSFNNNKDTILSVQATKVKVLQTNKLYEYITSKKEKTIDDCKVNNMVKVLDKEIK